MTISRRWFLAGMVVVPAISMARQVLPIVPGLESSTTGLSAPLPPLEEIASVLGSTSAHHGMWNDRGISFAVMLWLVMQDSVRLEGGRLDFARYVWFANLDNLTAWARKYRGNPSSDAALAYIENVPGAYARADRSHCRSALCQNAYVAMTLLQHPRMRMLQRANNEAWLTIGEPVAA